MTRPETLTPAAASKARRPAGLARLWVSEAFGSVGLQITLFVVPLVAVTVFDATALQIGALNSLESVAAIAFGLVTGLVIDRLGGSRAVALANVVRAVAAVTLLVGLLYWDGLWFLFVACVLIGVGSLANDAGVSTAVLELSSSRPRDLNRTNALLRVTTVASEVSGPGLGGLLVLSFGLAAASGAAAAAFGLAAGLLLVSMVLPMRQREPFGDIGRRGVDTAASGIEAGAGRFLSGGRFIWRHATLRPLVISSLHFNFFSAMVQSVFVIYCLHDLHFTTGDLAIVGVSGGAGGLIGGFIASSTAVAQRSRAVYLVALSLPGLCVWALLMERSAPHTTQVIGVMAAMGLWSAAMVVCLVLFNTVRQLQSPAHLVGRIASTERTLALGGELPGALLGGLLGTLISPTPALVLGAAGMMTAALWIARVPKGEAWTTTPD